MTISDAQAGWGMRAAVVGGAALLLLAGLGNIDAWAPDEPRYLSVAEEMRESPRGPSDWVLLHLNGEAYTQKPPLYYWLAAGLGLPFDRVTEVAGRLPSALAGVALVVLTFAFGGRLFGGRVGGIGAALLLTLFEFSRNARRMQLDVLLALFETAALVCFWHLDRGLGHRGRLLLGLHGCLGLAVLTKGPVGFLVPLVVIAAYLAWERRLRELPRFFPLWGIALAVGPALAWLAAASALAPSGFAGEALGPNLIGRFFSGTSHERPFYYFLHAYPTEFLPWTLLWPLVLLSGRQVFAAGAAAPAPGLGGEAAAARVRAWRLLLAWVGASLVFFSLSSGKRGIYLLPTYPAMALLCADALVLSLTGRARMPRALAATAGVFAASFALLGLELGFAAATTRSLVLANPTFPELRERTLGLLEAVEPGLILAFGSALFGVATLAVVAWVVLRRHRAAPLLRAGVAIATAFAIELAVFLLLFPALDPVRSPRPIAAAADAASPPDRAIGLYADRSMVGGLVYYGGRPVAELRNAEDVRDFVAKGPGTIVVKKRKLEGVAAVTPVEVVGSARTGRREVLIVRPVPEAAQPR